MANGFRSSSSADLASISATTTISLPAGVQPTDVVVVIFCTRQLVSPCTVSAPAGWTQITSGLNGNDGISQYVTINAFWALGNVAALGFTNSFSTGAKQGWECAAFTGVDNTTPIDATGIANFNHGSASLTANAVTIATAGAWEIIGFGDFFLNRFTATGFTPLENGTPATNQTACILYNSTPLGTGSTGTVSVSSNPLTGSSQILVAMPFALRPAPTLVTVTDGAPGSDDVTGIYLVDRTAPGTQDVTGTYWQTRAAPGADDVVGTYWLIRSAPGSDDTTLTGTLVIVEGVPGADGVTISGVFVVIEGAPGTDDATLTGTLILFDGAPGVDSATLTGTLIIVDAAPGADSVTLAGTLLIMEGAPGTDSVGLVGTLVVIEGSPGTDSVVITGTIVLIEGAPGQDAVTGIYTAVDGAPGASLITGYYVVVEGAPGSEFVNIIGLTILLIHEYPPGSDSATLTGTLVIVEDIPGRDDTGKLAALTEGAMGDMTVLKAYIIVEVPPPDPQRPMAGAVIVVTDEAPGETDIVVVERTITLVEGAPGGDTAFFGAPGTIVIEEFAPGVDTVSIADDTPCGSPCPDDDIVIQLDPYSFLYTAPIYAFSGGEAVFFGGFAEDHLWHVICSPYDKAVYLPGCVTHDFTFSWPGVEAESITLKARHSVKKGYVNASAKGFWLYGTDYPKIPPVEEDIAISTQMLTFDVTGTMATLRVVVCSSAATTDVFGHPFVPPRKDKPPPIAAPYVSGCSSFGPYPEATFHPHVVGTSFAPSDIAAIGLLNATSDADYWNFEDDWECVSVIIRPKCQKPVISIGTGTSKKVCSSVQSYIVGGQSNLPQWIKDGLRWIITDSDHMLGGSFIPGRIIYTSADIAPPDSEIDRVTLDDCGNITIYVQCFPGFIDATHKLGALYPDSLIFWPLHVQYLIFAGDRGQGMEFDVRTCSPFIQVIEKTCGKVIIIDHPPPPPNLGLGTRIRMLRDYTHRLFVFFLNKDDQVCVWCFNDEDKSPVNVMIDDYKGCHTLSFYREDVYVAGTYLQKDAPRFARSKTHSREWDVTDIPGSYASCTSTIHRGGRIVFLGFKNAAAGPPPVSAQWYCRVGVPNDDGSFNWSSEVKLNFTDPNGAGHLTTRSDGVLEFAWEDSSLAPHVSRARGVSNSGGLNTDWV